MESNGHGSFHGWYSFILPQRALSQLVKQVDLRLHLDYELEINCHTLIFKHIKITIETTFIAAQSAT